MRLFENEMSGNCYKVRLMLAHRGLDYESVPVSVKDRSNREELFGGKNPALRVPVLELDDGTFLAESNAILWYLAQGTELWPESDLERTRVLQWLFFEQYDHEPNLAVARYICIVLASPPAMADKLAACRQGGRKALAALERHLQEHDFLAADRYTIADIALYAYTHVAEDGGVSLEEFPAVRAWLARVAEQPGHVPMFAGGAAA